MDEPNVPPTQEEEGKFIPQKELEKWYKKMQKKYPQVFTVEDGVPEQKPMGHKLSGFLDDDDPNKATRVTVCGSKFENEPIMGKYVTPMYIVRYEGNDTLRTIHLTEVGDEGGWQDGW